MLKKIVILFFLILVLLSFDYFRVLSFYHREINTLNKRIDNQVYYWYFREVYKANNNNYLDLHTKEEYIAQYIRDSTEINLSDEDLENSYLRMTMEMYFTDPFSRNQFKYYPIYNSQNKIKGYILLSSGIDKHIDNVFDTKIYLNDLDKFKLYDKGFNYFDYYFGRKDILVESIFNKDNK